MPPQLHCTASVASETAPGDLKLREFDRVVFHGPKGIACELDSLTVALKHHLYRPASERRHEFDGWLPGGSRPRSNCGLICEVSLPIVPIRICGVFQVPRAIFAGALLELLYNELVDMLMLCHRSSSRPVGASALQLEGIVMQPGCRAGPHHFQEDYR